MLCVLSPAKSLDMEAPFPAGLEISNPRLLKEAKVLARIARQKTAQELSQLMKISEKLGVLNAQRFKEFQTPLLPEKSRPAMYAFTGDVYQGFDIQTLEQQYSPRLNHSVCILSGLYGLLKPYDQIMAYRLEMGTPLANPDGKNLYHYWQNTVTALINQDLESHKNKTLINLASREYFKVVQPDSLAGDSIQIEFLENKNGEYKIISFFAKKARGKMARWMVENDPQSPKDLHDFTEDGYTISLARSTQSTFVYTRN